MKTIEQIFEQAKVEDIIKDLTRKSIELPDWEDELKPQYEPSLHEIMVNKTKYPDKEIRRKEKSADGTTETEVLVRTEPITRICIGLQKLATKRISAFLFTIPVNSICEDIESEEGKVDKVKEAQFYAVKKVLKKNKWNTLNKQRCKVISSECEQATYWYTAEGEKENNYYGFKTKLSLKHSIFSPALGDSLYPLFDETGDMVAFSREYTATDEENKKVTHFETWTSEKYHHWVKGESGWTEAEAKDNPIGKIPIVYSYRPKPIWDDGDNGKVEQIEKLLSKNGDILDYHASPVLIIKGKLVGAPSKGEANKVFFTEDGAGGAEYASWQQSPESTKFQFETLLRMFWQEIQLPDLSYENVKGLGSPSGVALKFLFSDAHLKCGDESEIYEAMLEREYNIIKAYLGAMNLSWRESINELEIEPEIRFFIIDDEKQRVEVLVAANGGKPLVSQKTATKLSGMVDNPEIGRASCRERV